MVIIPCLIIIVMEIIRIVNVLGEEKRKKATELAEEKQLEIELLKQQLATLQATVTTNANTPPNDENTEMAPTSPTEKESQEIEDEQQ